MIYMTFNQWADGNFLETGEPRREAYSQAELDLVEMGWNYGYDAGVQWQKSQQSLDRMAENERELGIQMQPEPEPVAWTDIDFTNIYISKLVAKEKNANVPLYTSQLKHDIEAVANWMIDRSYATGHGDTIADLLKELEWQIRENEREACAQLCEDLWEDDGTAWDCAVAIESRGNK